MNRIRVSFVAFVLALLFAPLVAVAQTPVTLDVQAEGEPVPITIMIYTEADTVAITDVATPFSYEVSATVFSAVVNRSDGDMVSVKVARDALTATRTSRDPTIVTADGSTLSVSKYHEEDAGTPKE